MLSNLCSCNTPIIMLSFMKCRYPREMYLWRDSPDAKWNRSFKFSIAQKHSHDFQYREELVGCGQCIACRLNKSRDWAIRGILESYTHEENSFITLTYDDDHLPANNSLVKKDLQDFFKRLREHLSRKYPDVHVRYMAAGEYGEHTNRPHYHAIVYGFDFPDKEVFSVRKGNQYYTSELLSKLWTNGNHIIGDVNDLTIKYCCKYVLKKITGKQAKDHYKGRQPEFPLYSSRPAIGRTFFEQFTSDFFPKDFISINGKEMPIPRYFMKRLEQDYPSLFDEVKFARSLKVKQLVGEDVNRETGEILKAWTSAYSVAQANDRSDKYLNHMIAKSEKEKLL